ncbi:unnamed protein product [Nippostrongylus brasiliensis]|uniref:DUF2934 domain-containing protein n=1 Tax=Nippostrongylus brasiliensis TaxID=27835 RepID=A0A0N4YQJ9_NIPBR|nr:unnamed protein product [Nippostrongylus brasiliensis]
MAEHESEVYDAAWSQLGGTRPDQRVIDRHLDDEVKEDMEDAAPQRLPTQRNSRKLVRAPRNKESSQEDLDGRIPSHNTSSH